GDTVFVGHRLVDEFDGDVLADAFEIAVTPALKSEERCVAAAFLNIADAGSGTGVRVVLVRCSELDVDHPAVRLPSRNAGCETIIGPGDTPVMLFAELVLFGVRRRIAAQPELLDKLSPLV